MLRIKFDDALGTISYYRANGWKGKQSIINHMLYSNDYVEIQDNEEAYRLFPILHIEKPSKHKPACLIITTYSIADQNGSIIVAPIIAEVLKKSFTCGHGGDKNLEQSDIALCVNLDGSNYLYDHYIKPMKVINQ